MRVLQQYALQNLVASLSSNIHLSLVYFSISSSDVFFLPHCRKSGIWSWVRDPGEKVRQILKLATDSRRVSDPVTYLKVNIEKQI